MTTYFLKNPNGDFDDNISSLPLTKRRSSSAVPASGIHQQSNGVNNIQQQQPNGTI